MYCDSIIKDYFSSIHQAVFHALVAPFCHSHILQRTVHPPADYLSAYEAILDSCRHVRPIIILRSILLKNINPSQPFQSAESRALDLIGFASGSMYKEVRDFLIRFPQDVHKRAELLQNRFTRQSYGLLAAIGFSHPLLCRPQSEEPVKGV